MIGIYHYDNLTVKLNEIEIVSGSETRAVNEAYTLRAAVLPRTLRQRSIQITPFTVFETGGIFYRPKIFTASDNETGLVKIDAVDLLFADLIDCELASFEYAASAQVMLNALLAGTIFTVADCDDLGLKIIEMKNTSKLAVLNKILEQFDGELYRDGLTVCLKRRLDYLPNGEPYPLIKGKNIVTLEESVDTSTVITQLRYVDSTEDAPEERIIQSQYINYYPVKEAYKEFRGNADEQAKAYIEAYEQPHATYKVSVLPGFKCRFELGAVTQLLCEQININLTLRVAELTRDLTGQTGDKYTLGQKPKSFFELTAALFAREGQLTEAVNKIASDVDGMSLSDLLEDKDALDELTAPIIEKITEYIITGGAGSGVVIERMI